jgi:hypothetical protein
MDTHRPQCTVEAVPSLVKTRKQSMGPDGALSSSFYYYSIVLSHIIQNNEGLDIDHTPCRVRSPASIQLKSTLCVHTYLQK